MPGGSFFFFRFDVVQNSAFLSSFIFLFILRGMVWCIVAKANTDNTQARHKHPKTMAKLITDHDPFHIHKILGVLVLLHFLYRFFFCALGRGFVFCTVQNASGG